MNSISGASVAILATDGFEKSELFEPKRALQDAGAQVTIVSLDHGEIRSWDASDWGESVPVDRRVTEVDVGDFDALVLPGGQINPDLLRVDAQAIDFIRRFGESGKPLAAICHAPWLLIEAGLVSGCELTSYHSIITDVKNAGGKWLDAPVVRDTNIITSRRPDDLRAFCNALIDAIASHDSRPVAQRSTAD